MRKAWSLATSKRNYVEDLAVNYDTGLHKLTQRRARLLSALVFGLITTLVVWIASLRFPSAASGIIFNSFVSDVPRYGNVLGLLGFSIPFVPPFISAFALGNLLFPSQPEPEIQSGVMSTFAYRQNYNKRYLIVIAGGMLGALNCILLLVAVADANGN